MKFLSAYSDFDANSLLNGYYSEEPSRTKQSFKEEVDINTLVKRFGITGQMPVPSRLPTYDDFTGIDDYQSALNYIVCTITIQIISLDIWVNIFFIHSEYLFNFISVWTCN